MYCMTTMSTAMKRVILSTSVYLGFELWCFEATIWSPQQTSITAINSNSSYIPSHLVVVIYKKSLHTSQSFTKLIHWSVHAKCGRWPWPINAKTHTHKHRQHQHEHTVISWSKLRTYIVYISGVTVLSRLSSSLVLLFFLVLLNKCSARKQVFAFVAHSTNFKDRFSMQIARIHIIPHTIPSCCHCCCCKYFFFSLRYSTICKEWHSRPATRSWLHRKGGLRWEWCWREWDETSGVGRWLQSAVGETKWCSICDRNKV